MKKIYFLILTSLFLSPYNAAVYGQVVANNDFAYNANDLLGGYLPSGNFVAPIGVLANDSVDGHAAFFYVALTQISSTSPGLHLDAAGYLTIDPGTPEGTYQVTYQICSLTDQTDCATAILTVGVCNIATPTVSVVQPDCTSSGSVTLSGLPAGTWTISKRTYFSSVELTTGTGSSYTFTGVSPDTYYFKAINATNCASEQVTASVQTPTGMLVTPVGVYQDFNGNGAIDVGDVVNWHIDIANLQPCPLTNINIVYASLTLSSNSIASIPGLATDSSLIGTTVLTQENINYGQAGVGIWLSADSDAGPQYDKVGGTIQLGISDAIRLNAFFDTNGNGVQDGTEQNYPSGNFHYELNNDGVIHNIETNDGTFTLYDVNPANSFDVGFSADSYCAGQYSIAPNAYSNLTIPTGSGVTGYNFPITIVPCTDVYVYAARRETARPGFTYSHWILYGNTGNQAIPSGTITFTNDPAVTTTAVSQAGAVLNATGFTYNFTDLLPNEYRYFYVTMDVPASPAVNLGDALASSVSISLPPADNNAANNSAGITEIATNSYDPNDVSEIHGGSIVHSDFTQDDSLTYTIRFENTGNDNAISIKVNDTLDAKLEESSVRMVTASHPYVLERVNNSLTWTFGGINLPPSSTDANAGKGFITFNVKPKPGYAVGDTIPNTASIFFDSNPAIVTNTFNTEFVAALNVGEFASNDFTVYPNPTKNLVNIAVKTGRIDRIVVTDLLGKNMMTQTVGDASAQINLSHLSGGLYFVTVKSGNKQKTIKIIKE